MKIMWDRKELKEKAKAIIKSNLGICIVAALLLAISTGGGTPINTTININPNSRQIINQNIDTEFSENADSDTVNIDKEDIKELIPIIKNEFNSMSEQEKEEFLIGFGAFATIIILVTLFAIIIALVITAFLLVPLEVGARKFFIQNSENANTPLSKDNIGFGFSEHYMSIVKSVFITRLFIGLWSLLLIIPGVYKRYCWRLVPYLIGENPALTGNEARQISNDLMAGNKWNAFVLDISFLGWYLLGILTLGILNIVWTNPYKAQTDAELYKAITQRL